MITKETFGKRLAAWRKDLGWSQERLARKLECSRNTVDNIEKGYSGAGWNVLMKILTLESSLINGTDDGAD